MNLRSSLFMVLLCFGNIAHGSYLHVRPCEHNPIGGTFPICDSYHCGPTATPYHHHIEGIASSPLLRTSQELSNKVMDYMTYAGSEARRAIMRKLTKNPNIQSDGPLKIVVEQEMKYQQAMATADRQLLCIVACVGVCVFVGVLISDYIKRKKFRPTSA